MKIRALTMAGGLALTLTLTACGNDDEARAAEAIAASMMDAEDGDALTVDQAEADCVGEGLVDRIGVDKLKDYGLINDDMTLNESVTDMTMDEADATSAADVIVGCVDAQALFAEQFAADDTITPEQQECISEALDDETIKGMFSLIFQGKAEQATQELMAPMMSCMMG